MTNSNTPVMLNLFTFGGLTAQHPLCQVTQTMSGAQWILKQVQDDEGILL